MRTSGVRSTPAGIMLARVGTIAAILAATGIAALTWAARAHGAARGRATNPPSLTCNGSWTDDRSESIATITFPNYSPAEILIHPGETVNWDGGSATFQDHPLVDQSGQLWGTFSVNETSWPFTYHRSGPWEYYDMSNPTDAGIVCVTGPLSAAFTPTPTAPKPNQAVTFDGSGSSAGDYATIVDYKWDFGTGTFTDDTGSTSTAMHTFSKAGIYTVRLEVTDDGGQTNIMSKKLTVGTVITQAPKLMSTTVKETSAGKAPLGVENPNAISAKATVTLTQKSGSQTFQIGGASTTVPAHGTATVSVLLSPRARSYLASHSSLPAKAKVVLTANGTSKAASFSVTIDKA